MLGDSMSKREKLEEKRKELDKELKKHSNEDNSLYERSIIVAKLIAIFGNLAFVVSVGLGLFTCISFNTFLLFSIWLGKTKCLIIKPLFIIPSSLNFG